MKIDRGYDVKNVVTVSGSLDGTTHQLDKGSFLTSKRYWTGFGGFQEFVAQVRQNSFRYTRQHLSEDRLGWMDVRLRAVPR